MLFNPNSWMGNFSANFLSDVIVAIIIGIIFTRYFEKKEKSKEQKEKLKISVKMLLGEIEHNKSQLLIMINELSKANFPYPALEISVWETIDKQVILDRLKEEDFENLLFVYNRVKTINMLYYSMLNKVNWIEDLKVKPVIKKEFMEKLIDRCKELLNYINKYQLKKISEYIN